MKEIKELLAPVNDMLQSDSFFIKMLIALVILLIGWNFISLFIGMLKKTLIKKNFDKTLIPFMSNIALWAARVILIITLASYLGIETASFIAVIGAVSFAIGLALQGALGNFAGGVLILLNRPYKAGDLVEMQGNIGVVKEIQMFNTILLSPENKTIILPNGAVSNGNITNYTVEGLIRVDLSVGISYGSDIKKAKDIIYGIMSKNENVLKTPAAFVGVSKLADSSVNLAVRPFASPDKYWDVYFTLYEEIKNALDQGGIVIPFPQMDVTISK